MKEMLWLWHRGHCRLYKVVLQNFCAVDLSIQWGRNFCFNTFGGRSQNVCDQAVKNGRVRFVLIWCMVWSGLYCKTKENMVRGKPKKSFVKNIWNFANVQVVALFWDVVNAKKEKFVGEKWNQLKVVKTYTESPTDFDFHQKVGWGTRLSKLVNFCPSRITRKLIQNWGYIEIIIEK